MKALHLGILAATVGLLASAPVSANPTPAVRNDSAASAAVRPPKTRQAHDDKSLTDRIDARFKADATLKRFDLDVSVKDGVATVTGAVRTEAERLRAGRDAHVSGVTRVDNQVTVDKNAGRSTVATVGEKTKETAETVGSKTKQGVSKTGEVIDDAWINTKVHSRFVGEDLLKDSHIDVDVSNHVVTLKGTVKSTAGRARAAEIARTTDGVNRVVDNLKIQ